MRDTIGAVGTLQITERNRVTGEVNVWCEKNVITSVGFSELSKRLTYDTTDPEIAGSYLYRIVLGDDIGTGTLLNPTPADDSLVSEDQNVIYEIPVVDTSINYVSPTDFEFRTVLNGDVILDNYFPVDTVDMKYTSATLRFFNDKTCSYRRFPVRSLSRMIDIEIVWLISLVGNTL